MSGPSAPQLRAFTGAVLDRATVAGATRMRAVGSSMFPCVPSGSVLGLTPVDDLSLVRVGDVLAYVGVTGVVAHRVVGVETAGAGLCFVMRGDAQSASAVERVVAGALAYRVTHVSRRGLSYSTSGWFGRALARLAVERGWAFRGLGRAAAQFVLLHRHWRQLRAQLHS